MKKKSGLNNEISMYFHCSECLKEIPKGESPMTYQRIQVGYTQRGLQVWCTRHNLNIIHLDFLKQKVRIV